MSPSSLVQLFPMLLTNSIDKTVQYRPACRSMSSVTILPIKKLQRSSAKAIKKLHFLPLSVIPATLSCIRDTAPKDV